jgi:hypothetical protein
MPCSDGVNPVRYVDCAVQVTAGNAGLMDAIELLAAKLRICVDISRIPLVSPTTLMTALRFMVSRQRSNFITAKLEKTIDSFFDFLRIHLLDLKAVTDFLEQGYGQLAAQMFAELFESF